MKNLLTALVITLSLASGFSIVSAAGSSNTSSTTATSTSRYTIKVFENGAIWVYVYEEDGTFVAKYEEVI